jgi:DNA polymerase-3 subunit delta'
MEIIGHRSARNFFDTVLTNGRIAHAYLLTGPASVGKTTVAADFLTRLVSGPPSPESVDPWKALRRYPDFTLVEREEDEKSGKLKKNISVEQVRKLREKLAMGSFLGFYKIGVILEAEAMSLEAANALLKTLEEPAPNTVIVLISSHSGALPGTVASRAERLRFGLVSEGDLRSGLINRGFSEDRSEELSRLAEGRPGIALALAESEDKLRSDAECADSFAEALGAPVWRKIAFAEEAAPKKFGFETALLAAATIKVWQSVLRDALMIASGEPALIRRLASRDRIAAWAQKKEPREIAAALTAAIESRAALEENVSPRLALENILLKT